MITLETLENMKVEVGNSVNNFTMSRGSFVYNQDFQYRSELVLKDKKKDGDTLTLTYDDPDKGGQYIFIIKEENGDIELTSEFENVNVNRFWLTFDANPSEHVYGCGETYSKFEEH